MSTMSLRCALRPCCDNFQKPSTEVGEICDFFNDSTSERRALHIGMRVSEWDVRHLVCGRPLGASCFEYEYRAHGADLAYQRLLSGPHF